MKNTFKETVKEVYNTNKETVFKKDIHNFNKNLNTLNKNTSNTNTFRNKNNSSRNIDNSNNKKSRFDVASVMSSASRTIPSPQFDLPPPPHSSSSSTIWVILFFILLIMIMVGVVYYFQENIKEFIKPFFEDEDKNNKLKELQQKIKEEQEKRTKLEEKININKKEESKEESKKEPEEEIKQTYSSSKIVNEDGYCFIGTDNNMRHCVNAYKGDTCTSGDMYKRIDDCLIPKMSELSQCV